MATLSTLFYYCNNIEAMHHFYIELLDLEETYYDAKQGWLTFQIGDTGIVIIRGEQTRNTATEWAKQPGYRDGISEIHSWVLTLSPEEFSAAVSRLQTSDSALLTDSTISPQPGHKQFFVRDPMGRTIELYTTG